MKMNTMQTNDQSKPETDESFDNNRTKSRSRSRTSRQKRNI